MVNWFTFLENQPDVDHEKHQRGKASRVARVLRSPSEFAHQQLSTTNDRSRRFSSACCSPRPRWGGLFHRHFSSGPAQCQARSGDGMPWGKMVTLKDLARGKTR